MIIGREKFITAFLSGPCAMVIFTIGALSTSFELMIWNTGMSGWYDSSNANTLSYKKSKISCLVEISESDEIHEHGSREL